MLLIFYHGVIVIMCSNMGPVCMQGRNFQSEMFHFSVIKSTQVRK